jgi:hypothetical protein
VAGGGKTAADLGAWVCFEDESGRSLRPPIARTWGRRGNTPLITVPARRAGRVNIAALACCRPGHRPRLIDRLRVCRRRRGEPKGFTWRDYRDLITAAHHQLPGGKIVLVWDNLNIHRQAETQALAGVRWLRIFRLPPYAPDLNPAEGIWSALHRTALANLAATGLDHLAAVIRHGLKSFQYRPGLISSCLAETGLRLRSRPAPAPPASPAGNGHPAPGTTSPQAPGDRVPVLIPVPP